MNVDTLFRSLSSFDFICDESVAWARDNVVGKGHTPASVLALLAEDTTLSDRDRMIWTRNAKRLFAEPATVRLGGDAVETDNYRVMVNGMIALQGSNSECQYMVDTMSWVKLVKINGSTITEGTLDDFNRAETVIGDVYEARDQLMSLPVVVQREVADHAYGTSVWEPPT